MLGGESHTSNSSSKPLAHGNDHHIIIKEVMAASSSSHMVYNGSYPSAKETPDLPPSIGHSSDDWRPYILHSCIQSNNTRKFAPCLTSQYPKIVIAEELVYPDFRIKLPSFISQEHEKIWLTLWDQFTEDEHDRCIVDRGWAYYRGQHGQNLVLEDVRVPAHVMSRLSTWGPTG